MEIKGIHSIFFVVSDLKRSVDYYRKLLQMEPQQYGNLASFPIGDSQLLLHAESEAMRSRLATVRGSGVALHINVKGVDEYCQRLKQLGVPILEEPQDQPYGVREFMLKDPDGYEVEFVEPIDRKG